MKRLFAMLLSLLLLFSVPASAASYYLDLYYTCFFDGHRANSIYGSNLDFDAMILNVYFTSDDQISYYEKKILKKGTWSETGSVVAIYKETSSTGFTLTMPDGTVFPGYFDLYGEDIWLDIGAGYFRLHRVKSINYKDDWRKE